MAKWFKNLFGESGDKTSVPNTTDPSGYVSYQNGFPADYQRSYPSDPLAKTVDRQTINQLFYDVTGAIQQYQTHGFPDYIDATTNGGTAYAYELNAIVRFTDGLNYRNTVAGNTNAPNVSGWVLYNDPSSAINSATAKTTPVDADLVGIADSAASFALKKVTWANIKATILSSFGVMINSATAKATPIDADIIIIGDGAGSYASKKVTLADLKTFISSAFVALTGNQTITGVKTFANIVINGTTKAAGYLYSGTVDPTNTNRLNYDGYFYAKKLYSEGEEVAKVVLGTSVSATGTGIDFTGLPSWVKKITVMLNGVSTNGTSRIQVQIGSGSVMTSGYAGSATDGDVSIQYSNGFINGGSLSSNIVYIANTLIKVNGNTWLSQHVGGYSNITSFMSGAGSATLSGGLDRIRITTVNGTDTFDAGTINITYEG